MRRSLLFLIIIFTLIATVIGRNHFDWLKGDNVVSQVASPVVPKIKNNEPTEVKNPPKLQHSAPSQMKPTVNNVCNPNYSGACVPNASDVDCAGGKGNGPAYVSGPVYVVGVDVYKLDRDGDGVACD